MWLSGELAGTTPLTLHPKLGEYALRVTRERYAEIAMPLTLTRPGAAQPMDLTLVPTIASVVVTTNPPGAAASVGGIGRGPTPVTVDGLKPGEAVEVQVMLPGYRSENRSVTPSGGEAPFAVEIDLSTIEEFDTAPTGTNTPAPTATPKAAVPEKTPVVAKALAAGMGLLSVEITGGWGEVWVDGVLLAPRTPLEGAQLVAGEHSLRVVNPTTGAERTKTVLITDGKETRQKLALE